MKTYTLTPQNHATIIDFEVPETVGVNVIRITVLVTCNGVEGEASVAWTRDYPKEDYPEAKSEWECPQITMPIWDASAGDNSRADRVRAYECLLDVTDHYFDLFIKGK